MIRVKIGDFRLNYRLDSLFDISVAKFRQLLGYIHDPENEYYKDEEVLAQWLEDQADLTNTALLRAIRLKEELMRDPKQFGKRTSQEYIKQNQKNFMLKQDIITAKKRHDKVMKLRDIYLKGDK